MAGPRRMSLACGGRWQGRAESGVSLVELLVATTIACVVLAGSWAWLWNIGVVSSATADRARAATAAAFAVRSIADDLDASASLQAPPAPYLPARALTLLHLHPDVAAETVLIVWDPARRVLWRKAPGTYLADHVSHFGVAYLDSAGRELPPTDLVGSAWCGRVAVVAVTVVVSAGHESAAASCSLALGQR
jgi:hypothetical protein